MKLVLACGQDEWAALYIDGRLAYQASSMNFGQFFQLLQERGGFPVIIESYQPFELNDEQQQQLNYHGMFPDRLVDISKDEWFSDE